MSATRRPCQLREHPQREHPQRELPVLRQLHAPRVLEALAPVSRASFLVLQRVTGLPYKALLGCLVQLIEDGLVTSFPRATGSSAAAFSLTSLGERALRERRGGAPVARAGGRLAGERGVTG